MGKRTSFGIKARRTILRGGGALDTIDSKPYHYVMLTGTIPGSTPQCFAAMACYSSYVVHRLGDWVRYHAKNAHWFYSWELQNRGALHIHWCVHVPDTYTRCKILFTFWDEWKATMDSISEMSGTDMWRKNEHYSHSTNKGVLQADAAQCYKSVAAYVAGYTSGNGDKHSKDKESPYYPSRWWGMSRSLTALLKSLTEKVSSEHNGYREARQEILLHHERTKDFTEHKYHYDHRVGIGSTSVSYHPLDKGQALWEQLTMKKHPPSLYPNASSWIHSIAVYLRTVRPYIKALRKSSTVDLPRLLSLLEDSTLQRSLSEYTLHHSHIRMMLECNSVYSLNMLAKHTEASTLSQCVTAIWLYHQNRLSLQWGKENWLSLYNDIPIGIDKMDPYWHTGTSTPDKGGSACAGETDTLLSHSPLTQLMIDGLA